MLNVIAKSVRLLRIWVRCLFICTNYVTVLQRDAVFCLVVAVFCRFKSSNSSEFSIRTMRHRPRCIYAALNVKGEKKTLKSMWKKMRERRMASEGIEDKDVGDKVQCKTKNEEKRKINHYRWGDPLSFDVYFFCFTSLTSFDYYDCKSIK